MAVEINKFFEPPGKKLAALERTDGCLCFGSGMAAITSVAVYRLRPGDHAVVVDHAYGLHFMKTFLADFGVETTSVKGVTIGEFESALRETVAWYRDHPEWWRPIKSGEFLEYYKRQYGEQAGQG